MVFPAPVNLCFIPACGGYPYFGGGICWNDKLPLEKVTLTFPMTFNAPRDGLVSAVDIIQSFDGIRLKGEFRVER